MEKPALQEAPQEMPMEEAPQGEPAHVQMIDQVISMLEAGDVEGAIAALQQMKGEEAVEPQPEESPKGQQMMSDALDKMGIK